MKSTKPHWIAIIILSSIILGIGFKLIVLGSTIKGEDSRTAIVLTTAERQAVLGEMRTFLETTQSIVEALANDDLSTVEQSAKQVGSNAVSTMDFTLKAKLPLDFKTLGFGVHDAFDEIAEMAKNKASSKAIQLKLSDTMNSCVACHASFQLPIIPSRHH